MSEDVVFLIASHRVRGTRRRWEAASRPGDAYDWDCGVVEVGQLGDGRWYVERRVHPRMTPARAQAYPTEAQALAVAEAVMAEFSEALDGREFVEVATGAG